MTDRFAGHEIAGHENDGPKCRQDVKWREKKYTFNRDSTTKLLCTF